MRILVRVDASTPIGHGHVMRQLALASALREAGGAVEFLCRREPGGAEHLIVQHAFPLGHLESSAHLSQRIDAEATKLAAKRHFDWLIVDHYGLDASWEHAIREICDRILVVDDLANRPHDCDILLDQNYYVSASSRYKSWVQAGTTCLLGTAFALLRPEFSSLRPEGPRTGPVHRVLVSFGATDPADQTLVALHAIRSLASRGLHVDVVIGRTNPNQDHIRMLAGSLESALLHIETPCMATLMSRADLALGAGGVSTNERMCVGLPAIVASTNQLQEQSARDVDSLGAHRYIGRASDLDINSYRNALIGLLEQPEKLRKMSKVGLDQLDGLGARRVADIIMRAQAPGH